MVMICNIISLTLSISAIIMSFIIYKLQSKETKRGLYFKEIATLYYKIDEVHQLMKNDKISGKDKNIGYYENRIKVYCTILLNYIKKYPNPKSETEVLENILLTIIVNPNWDNDYEIFSNEFQNFCWAIDMKQQKRYQFTTK